MNLTPSIRKQIFQMTIAQLFLVKTVYSYQLPSSSGLLVDSFFRVNESLFNHFLFSLPANGNVYMRCLNVSLLWLRVQIRACSLCCFLQWGLVCCEHWTNHHCPWTGDVWHFVGLAETCGSCPFVFHLKVLTLTGFFSPILGLFSVLLFCFVFLFMCSVTSFYFVN